jgi:hypothetical protein
MEILHINFLAWAFRHSRIIRTGETRMPTFDHENVELPDPLCCPGCTNTFPLDDFKANEELGNPYSYYTSINICRTCPSCGYKVHAGSYLEHNLND